MLGCGGLRKRVEDRKRGERERERGGSGYSMGGRLLQQSIRLNWTLRQERVSTITEGYPSPGPPSSVRRREKGEPDDDKSGGHNTVFCFWLLGSSPLRGGENLTGKELSVRVCQ